MILEIAFVTDISGGVQRVMDVADDVVPDDHRARTKTVKCGRKAPEDRREEQEGCRDDADDPELPVRVDDLLRLRGHGSGGSRAGPGRGGRGADLHRRWQPHRRPVLAHGHAADDDVVEVEDRLAVPPGVSKVARADELVPKSWDA